MLDILFGLYRNSRKSCRIDQFLGEKMSVPVLRFLRCGGTWFKAHLHNALTNFIRNLVSVLFAGKIEEHGNGNDGIITKDMYTKIVGIPEIWSKFEFIATVKLYFKVLKETAHLFLLLDGLVIYQLAEAVTFVMMRIMIIHLLPFHADDDANWLLHYWVHIKILSRVVHQIWLKR